MMSVKDSSICNISQRFDFGSGKHAAICLYDAECYSLVKRLLCHTLIGRQTATSYPTGHLAAFLRPVVRVCWVRSLFSCCLAGCRQHKLFILQSFLIIQFCFLTVCGSDFEILKISVYSTELEGVCAIIRMQFSRSVHVLGRGQDGCWVHIHHSNGVERAEIPS